MLQTVKTFILVAHKNSVQPLALDLTPQLNTPTSVAAQAPKKIFIAKISVPVRLDKLSMRSQNEVAQHEKPATW